MTLWRSAILMCVLVLGDAGLAGASRTPVEPVLPTGCASGPEAAFDVGITASRQWGVVPFQVRLQADVLGGYDPAVAVTWDLDGDGVADASGMVVEHTFTDPVDYGVTAWISTQSHGEVVRSTVIAGYAALMSLTFDDAHQSARTVAFPILEARGLTATAYIVPTWTSTGWYLTWDDLHLLQENHWDIGSHTLTHPNLTQVDSATLHHELSESKAQLEARGFPARNFAVPFGACSWTVIDAAKLYYESCRSWPGVNPPIEETDSYDLRWDVTKRTKPLGAYTFWMDSLATSGGWYILNSHIVWPDCGAISNCVTDTMFANILDYALEHRFKILNVDEALASREGEPLAPPPPIGPSPAGRLAITVERNGRSGLPLAISFTAPSGAGVEIAIYDVAGRRVRTLDPPRAGRHSITWEGDNDSGAPVASGIYFCVLAAADGRTAVRKVTVVR